ncbi:serine:threonine protein kinase LATS1 [Trichuris trichiura]|uniref:non-specific serine/threonine protein kinase n=1 Tax=Trichuris trichiura TaxID=36087 RepID=A0A077Z5R6_TRITR|nr:serine:threonine protein kinase LATS1 [Trichuris trichiura]
MQDSSGHRLDANNGDASQCYVNEAVGLGLKTAKNYKADKAGQVTDYSSSANDTNCVLFRKANPRISDYEYSGCFSRTAVPTAAAHEEDRIVREVSALAYYKNRLESIELLSSVEGCNAMTFNQYRGLLNRVGATADSSSCGLASIGQSSLGHIPFMSELTCAQVASDSFYIENLCRRVNNVLSTTKGALTNDESAHGSTQLEPCSMGLPLCDRISPASSLSTDDSEILVGQESATITSAGQSIRCCSPLAESIQTKLQLGAYEFFNMLRPCTPQAFRFYMEQHVENVLKMYKERLNRQMQLEKEMARADFPAQLQCQMRKLLTQKESCYLRLRRQRMDASMFEKIKTIGIGAFGEVALVRKKDTETLFAMKVLRKFDVIKKNQAAHVKAERDILSEADNEWVVKLYYSFQDKDCLFFIMEYIPGGDMMALLIKKGLFEEQLAKFYVAELVCAIHSVHKLGFIHRDIKPDNILIDRNGHIKLTDFGLCTGLRWTHDWKYYAEQPLLHGHKQEDSFDLLQQVEPQYNHKVLDYRHRKQRCKAHSLVGTPNYIAPEVLLRIGHTQLCDWWSVGVIFYEMVVGHPPFLANTPEETQAKVIHWRSSLHIPKGANLSEAATDLILQLCCGPENRLGKDKEAADIKRHPFFQGIDWENLRNVKAPYRPEILHATDTSNFDPVEPRQDMSGDQSAAGIVDHAFYEFTFRRFFDSDGYGCPTLRLSPPKKLDNSLQPQSEVADTVDHSSSSSCSSSSRASDNKNNVLRISTGT